MSIRWTRRYPAGRTAVSGDRSDGAAGQHLRAEPGQFRDRAADHVPQHLDGRPELLVFIKAPDGPHMVELQDEVRALMRARRHVPFARGRYLRHQRVGHPDVRVAEPDGHDLRGDHRAGGGVHGGGRHRDHEHHAGQRDGADARDRHPQIGGSAAAGHPVAVRDRGGSDVERRRDRRRAAGSRRSRAS